MVKLIAIDMDGTLLDSHKKLPARNIKAVQEAAQVGCQIVLCTGRSQTGVETYFTELGLAAEQEYAILNNGCSLHRIGKDWELLTYHGLDFDEIEALYALLEDYPDVYLTLIADTDYLVVASEVPDLVAYDASLVFTQAQAVSLAEVKNYGKPVFQAMYMGEAQVLNAFQSALEARLAERFSTVRSQSYIFEVMPQHVTKASGLRELAQILGIKSTDIMALGDAPNDLEMLQAAGFSVAMANASQEIKEIADRVTASNDDAGVALAIEEYILN